MNPTKLINEYAMDVVDGRLPAGKPVIQACRRHLRDCDRTDLYWDEAYLRDFFDLVPCFRFAEGEVRDKPVQLASFQAFIVGSVYGWRYGKGGPRRYSQAFVELARKNGKTTLLGLLGVIELLLTNSGRPQVFTIATKQKQAKECFNAAVAILDCSPQISPLFKIYRDKIEYPENAGFFEPLTTPTNPASLEGSNPSLVVCDELHAWGDLGAKHFSSLANGMVRKDKTIFSITTAGRDTRPSNYCYAKRRGALKSLKENLKDPKSGNDRLFSYIVEFDNPREDWKQPAKWPVVNPALIDGLKSYEAIRSALAEIKSHPSTRWDILRQQFSIWSKSGASWLPDSRWEKAADSTVTEEDLKVARFVLGLDLAEVQDYSAIAQIWLLPGDIWYFRPTLYLPEKQADIRDQAGSKVRYWEERGWVRIQPGEALDNRVIKEELLQRIRGNDARFIGLGYDPHCARQLSGELAEEVGALRICPVPQNTGHLSEPMRRIEQRVINGGFQHDGNECMTWMVGNVALFADQAGAVRPNKKTSLDKIDGVSAMASAAALLTNSYRGITARASLFEQLKPGDLTATMGGGTKQS